MWRWEHRFCIVMNSVGASVTLLPKDEDEIVATYLLTSQSNPAVYSTFSFSPKQTSSTGARCLNLCKSFPSPTAPFSSRRSYTYTYLSHDDTTKRVEFGYGENLTAEMASAGGEVKANCAGSRVSKCAVFIGLFTHFSIAQYLLEAIGPSNKRISEFK